MLSIVVVNHNAGPGLTEGLGALAALPGEWELVVVDNASRDTSIAALETRFSGDGRLRVIRNPDNRGFAAACNQGARATRGGLLLFLNPDVVCAPEAVLTLERALVEHPEAAMAGPLLCNPDGSEQRGCRRDLPTPMQALAAAGGLTRLWPHRFPDFNHLGRPLPAGPAAVPAISGAFMLVRREAFDAVGGWDERYFLHAEDLDLCCRIGRLGRSILFVPAARALHRQGTCSRARPWWVELHKHRGLWRYFCKCHVRGAPGRGVLAVLVAGAFLMRAVVLVRRAGRRH